MSWIGSDVNDTAHQSEISWPHIVSDTLLDIRNIILLSQIMDVGVEGVVQGTYELTFDKFLS